MKYSSNAMWSSIEPTKDIHDTMEQAHEAAAAARKQLQGE